MKKILSTLSVALLMSAAQGQVVFSSDLSNWSDGAPTDFMGAKTNLAASGVTEVTEGSVYGTSNVRLENTASGHKRFTTQSVAVEDGQGYEIKVWAKGQGDLRFGLFDNREGSSSGYSDYSAYNTINTTTLTEYSYQVACANTNADGEFILSIRNTVAPNHLEIDSMSVSLVTITPPAPVSIYDIQYTENPNGDSPLKDQVVLTGGIVTAVRGDGRFWIKSGNGPWTGVYVYYAPTTPVALGDSVTFSATVVEYNGLTELSYISDFAIVNSGNFFMSNTVTSAQAASEAYEGCLVRVNNANCTVGPDQYNEWTINDGSGAAKVDDFLFSYTPTVGQAYNVTGVVEYYQNFKILPRDANDISTSNVAVFEVEGMNVSIYPIPAQDVLNIQLSTNIPQEVIVRDIQGKQLERFMSNGNNRLSIAHYAPGVYFVSVNGKAQRFVKQ